MKFEVFVTLKDEVLDPQGKAVENALNNIGLKSIKQVRQGKYFVLDIDENDENKASEFVKASCEKLLTNQMLKRFLEEQIDFWSSSQVLPLINLTSTIIYRKS